PRAIGRPLRDDVAPELGTDAAGRAVLAGWRGTPGATSLWLLDLRSGAERSVPAAIDPRLRVLAVTVFAGRLVYATTSGRHAASSLWQLEPGSAVPRRLARHRGQIGELDSGRLGVAYVVSEPADSTTETIRLWRPKHPEQTVDRGGGGVMEGSYDVGSPSFAGDRLLWLGANDYDDTSDLFRLDLRTGRRTQVPLHRITVHAIAADDARPAAAPVVTYDHGGYDDGSLHDPITAALACRRCWRRR
ncbi:MAG: hypothetical protein JWQ18_2823, partial [Conexibacter sp.]|nr:hypothetical protein [Conexibacter sp.]